MVDSFGGDRHPLTFAVEESEVRCSYFSGCRIEMSEAHSSYPSHFYWEGGWPKASRVGLLDWTEAPATRHIVRSAHHVPPSPRADKERRFADFARRLWKDSSHSELLGQHQNLPTARHLGPGAIEFGNQRLLRIATRGAIERGLIGELVHRHV